MITKQEILAALEASSWTSDKITQIYGLALKGLESESTVKRLIQARDQWRKKHDDLADELDDKIIALEDKLKNTVTLKYHDELVNSANRRIISLRDERDAFHRLVGELRTEKNCMRADLENMCKEQEALKSEIVKHEENYRGKNAVIDKLITENKERARRERELEVVLDEWAAVEVYLRKSPKLTIGDKLSVACLRLLQERDELEVELGGKDDDWILSVSYYKNLAAVWEKRAVEMRAQLKKFEAFFTGND